MQLTALCIPRYAGQTKTMLRAMTSGHHAFGKTIVRVMKLTAFLLVVACLQVSARSLSQTITFSGKSVSLEKVFAEIKKQTGYFVFCNSAILRDSRPVTVSANNQPLDRFVQSVLHDQPLEYFFRDRSIIIKRKLPAAETAAPALTTEAAMPPITVRGRILDEKGEPVIASVLVKGANIGVTSDEQGNFELREIDEQAVLLITATNIESLEFRVNRQTEISISVTTSVNPLKDIVVTALGIKKEKKRLGYALQEVKGPDLVKARAPNVLSNLTGKVAGLRIANSADFFGAPDVKLRGVTPLFVLNGIPLESATMWEISGDDVESYSILKGPAASALYGSRGVNGAIQITTKKGSGAGRGPLFEFNSTTTFELGIIANPKIQHEYGTGYQGTYIQGDPTYEYWGAWGPKLDGRMLVQYNSPVNANGEKQPIPWISRGKNNLDNFLRTGMLSVNNISFSTSNENSDFRASFSQLYQKGVVPNTKLGGTTFNMSGGVNLSKKLRFDAAVNYNKLYTPNYPNIGYGRSSFIYGLTLWTGDNVDVRDLRDYWVPGKVGLQQRNYEEANDYNNPYFVAYEQTNGYYKDATFGAASLKYKLNSDMNITARTGINSYGLYRPVVIPRSYNYPRTGNYSETHYNMFESNTDVLIDYSKTLSDIDIRASVGASMRNWTERNIFGSTDGLNVPGWNNFSNSANQNTPTNFKRQLIEYGMYGSVDLSYRNYLFVGFTGRYDKSSTLPLDHNGYFYPSASISTILNEYLKLPQMISYAKLRAAITKVGMGMTPYSATVAYTPGIRWNDNPTLLYPSTNLSRNIKPSFSTGTEFGAELNLWKRIGVDIAYFDFVDGPQTYLQAISSTSGYSNLLTNGRKTERKGWELTINAAAISTKDFKWNVVLNWSTFKQYLKALAPGVTNEGLLVVGDRLDMIQGSGLMYANDGQLIIGSDGIPQRDQIKKNLGYYGDDWIAGLNNVFNYKRFLLSFAFDARIGGKIISSYERYLWAGGRHLKLNNADREGWYEGNDYTAAGVKVISGELQRDGNGKVISDTRKYAANDIKTTYFDYIQQTFGYYGNDEVAIVDRSFVKLRELILTYRLPISPAKKNFIKNASVSFVGRNLLLITKSGVIDPDQFTGASDNLQTPAFRNIGINLNVNF